jgi:hypothetical protein
MATSGICCNGFDTGIHVVCPADAELVIVGAAPVDVDGAVPGTDEKAVGEINGAGAIQVLATIG